MEHLLKRIPKEHQELFRDVVALIDSFCEHHLNDDYQQLARDMAFKLFKKKTMPKKGKAVGWASGIVHTLGRVNFLFDPKQTPHMTSAQLADGFGVSKSTMMAKSKRIMDALSISVMDPDWTLPSLMDDNPMAWMIRVNGIIIDARTASRSVQEEAHRLGLIPYVPEPQETRPSEVVIDTGQNPTRQNAKGKSETTQEDDNTGMDLFDWARDQER